MCSQRDSNAVSTLKFSKLSIRLSIHGSGKVFRMGGVVKRW